MSTSMPRAKSWLTSWTLALRLTRRDIRKHWARSLLIVATVFFPVFVLMGAVIANSTTALQPEETHEMAYGQAQAGILPQTPILPASPQAGKPASLTHTVDYLQSLTGGSIHPTRISTGVALTNRSTYCLGTILLADPSLPVMRGKIDLLDGRWPTTPNEILVTPLAREREAPSEGLAQLSRGNTHVPVTVVGTAQAFDHTGAPVEYVGLLNTALPTLSTPSEGGATDTPLYLWDRPTDLTEAEKRTLNDSGYVMAYAGTSQRFYDSNGSAFSIEDSSQQEYLPVLFFGLVVAGLFIETALLTGPAFAVSINRRRRTLALAALNGATPSQLRRTVLAQALILGCGAIALGFAAAIAAVAGYTHFFASAKYSWKYVGSDIPWGYTSFIAGCAVVATVCAALMPARGLGRLNVMAALRDRTPQQRMNRRLPLIGLTVTSLSTLAIVGGIVQLLHGTHVDAMTILVSVSLIILVLGVIMVLPAVMHVVGRLCRHAPLALRLAARDSSRHASRTVPAIASIMAAVGGFTALLMLASSTLLAWTQPLSGSGAEEPPIQRTTWAIVTGNNGFTSVDVQAVVHKVIPSAFVAAQHSLGNQENGTTTPKVTVAGLTTSHCTLPAVLTTHDDAEKKRPCELPVSPATGVSELPFWVIDSTLATRLFGLNTHAAEVLNQGGVVVDNPDWIVGGHAQLSVATATLSVDDSAEDSELPQLSGLTTHSIPAVVLPPPGLNLPKEVREIARNDDTTYWVGALITPETARKYRLPLRNQRYLVNATEPLTMTQVVDIEEEFQGQAHIASAVDYVPGVWRLIPYAFVLIAIALVAIASLTSTALSVHDSRADMTTLAAIGATRRLRRQITAWQTWLVAAIGSGLGVVVGLIPGIAVTWAALSAQQLTMNDVDSLSITAAPFGEVIASIPWLQLCVVTVLTPLLMAGVSALMIRKAPTATRRVEW